MSAPIVIYLETNWLVSAVLPHHPWQSAALQLLADADAGMCRIRIPTVAFLEARHVVERETHSHGKAIAAVVEGLQAASRSTGRPDLGKLAQSLLAAEGSYKLANPRKALADFAARCQQFAFSNVESEQAMLDHLRSNIDMRGADITDLHVLVAVAADRTAELSSPAAFLSTDSQAFAVHGSSTKLPRDFYAARKLVYLDKFSLATAERRWAQAERNGWPTPAPPQADPYLQEAQRVLYGLSEDKRAIALAALKSLPP